MDGVTLVLAIAYLWSHWFACSGQTSVPRLTNAESGGVCRDDQIQCPGTELCIYSSWLCDLDSDCDDNWDETNCYTSMEIDNVTIPLCTNHHFCGSNSCSDDIQDAPKFCHCDSACTFFGDCCIDYDEEACRLKQSDTFQNVFKSRDLDMKADQECVPLTEYGSSYWMVTTCNKDTGIVRNRCQEPLCNDTLSNIPVTDAVGITYRNVYCAVCHNVPTSELTAWQAELECSQSDYLYEDEINTDFLCHSCSLTMSPPAAFQSSLITARKCPGPLMYSQCDVESDDFHHRDCGSYMAMMEVNAVLYKNPHCLLCRDVIDLNSLDKPKCDGVYIPRYSDIQYIPVDIPDIPIQIPSAPTYEQPTGSDNSTYDEYYDYNNSFSLIDKGMGLVGDMSSVPIYFDPVVPVIGVPLSIVLDFGSSNRASSVKIMRNADIVMETTMTCPEGEVYVEQRDGSGSCVRLSCAEGLKLQDGKCVHDTSQLACGSDVSNQTVSLTVTFDMSKGICNDYSFKDDIVSEAVLTRLLGIEIVSDLFISGKSAKCNDVVTNFIDITYTLSDTEDLFQMLQDRIQKYEITNKFQLRPEIVSTIARIEMTSSCLDSRMEYSCESEWIPESEHIVSVQNGSYALFLNKSSEWSTPDGIILRVRYLYDNNTADFTRIYDVQMCHLDNYLSCPYIMMNMSLFEYWNSSDGMIRHMPTGHMMTPDEYMIMSGDEVMVCNFLNQSVLLNVTYTVTFFEYSNAQTIVSIIGSVLSLIAVILTFLTYAVFASLRNRASRLIMNLVIALFLGQFLLLFGGSRTQNQTGCMSIALLAHYSWLSAFAWMNALAFDLDRTFGNPDNMQKISEGKKSLVLYMAYAWGSPLLIVMPCLAIHLCQCTQLNFQYGSNSACWISDGTANLLTFGLPAAIFLLFNAILFGHTVAGIRRTKKATARIHQDVPKLKRTTKELLIYIKIASLMGFTWIFGYIAAFTGIETLWYLYIILNSLQGVFIFISFMCNRRVALLWSKRLKLSGWIPVGQRSSTSGAPTRNRTTSAKNSTQMTPLSSRQSNGEPDGSEQPLNGGTKV